LRDWGSVKRSPDLIVHARIEPFRS
jgi:hypothetical protein